MHPRSLTCVCLLVWELAAHLGSLPRHCKGHIPTQIIFVYHTAAVLCTATQLLWSFAALTFLPVALDMLPVCYSLTKAFPTIPNTHVDVVSGAAAAVAFIGELFMVKAMLVYDDHSSGAGQAGLASKVCCTLDIEAAVPWQHACMDET